MTQYLDSRTGCKLLYNSQTQNEGALILLRSKLSVISQRLGFSERKRESMLLVASELASNNIKHANGHGLVQIWQQPGPILDIFALDFGPGIADLPRAETDGYSTTNTLGKGLGTIRRLSDESFIYTQQESFGHVKKWSGTVVLARFHVKDEMEAASKDIASGFKIGLFARPLSDSRYNGDRIYLQKDGDKLRWLHLDGLGHGEKAQSVTNDLAPHLSHCNNPSVLLDMVDQQLVGTRGAVGISGEIDLAQRKMHVIGVGDMHAHLYDQEQMHNIFFAAGILGREHRTPSTFQADFNANCLVVTASDGIRRNWDAANFTGLFQKHPQLIAYTLGNIMGRISDDQSLCVLTVG